MDYDTEIIILNLERNWKALIGYAEHTISFSPTPGLLCSYCCFVIFLKTSDGTLVTVLQHQSFCGSRLIYSQLESTFKTDANLQLPSEKCGQS